SLTLPISINRKGGKWVYYFGIVEYNLVGSGQKLAFITGQELERKLNYLEYGNNSFLPLKLHLSARGTLLSDGYSYLLSVEKPTQSRTQKYAYAASISGDELTERTYFDGNLFDKLPDDSLGRLAKTLEGQPNTLVQFDHAATHNVSVSGLRSFGDRNKLDVGGFFKYKDRYMHDSRPRFSGLLSRY